MDPSEHNVNINSSIYSKETLNEKTWTLKAKALTKTQIDNIISKNKKNDLEKAKNLLKNFNQNVSKENLSKLYNFLIEKT